jgi:DNA ligase (NAD+)
MSTPDSPTQTVGAKVQPQNGTTTVRHSTPMLSLNNTYNEEEVYAFDERVLKGLGTVRFALTRFGRWKF